LPRPTTRLCKPWNGTMVAWQCYAPGWFLWSEACG